MSKLDDILDRFAESEWSHAMTGSSEGLPDQKDTKRQIKESRA